MNRLVVGWLYADYLNVYGDRGNVIALTRRLEWRGFDVKVVRIGKGAAPELDEVDLAFIGGGQDLEQERIHDDFVATKAEPLRRLVEQDLAVLGVCAGFQLLGKAYVTPSGRELPGGGILDAVTHSHGVRFVGDAIWESALPGLEGEPLVGFENHGGRTYLGAEAKPLARVVKGFGNNGEDRTAGAWRRNVIGTYLHGALLPRNPALTDWLIARALARRGLAPELAPLDDAVERAAHGYVLRAPARQHILR
ncbi:MAG: glutamine amidotransferase [Vulcanimicrobiaceae bacterium]